MPSRSPRILVSAGLNRNRVLSALTAVNLLVFAVVLGLPTATPGGLGFVEAGMTALLALAGVDPGDAVAATFAYRLFSYWLPLPFGLLGMVLAPRNVPPQAADPAS